MTLEEWVSPHMLTFQLNIMATQFTISSLCIFHTLIKKQDLVYYLYLFILKVILVVSKFGNYGKAAMKTHVQLSC